jgi:hypothetical protein
MERIIAEIYKDGKRIVMVDLTDLVEEDLEFFYQAREAVGHVVITKRIEE